MESVGYKRVKTVIGTTELFLDIYNPLQGKSSLTVCEVTDGDKGGIVIDGRKADYDENMNAVIILGLQDLHREMTEAGYLVDMLAGMTSAQAIEWLIALYDAKHNGKAVCTMRTIHVWRGIRFSKNDIDELDAAKNFVEIFESAFLKAREEHTGNKFSANDCERFEIDIQLSLRRDRSSGNTSTQEMMHLFRRAGSGKWKTLFSMSPESAAKEIFNAQKDKRNEKRREQVPYIITDLIEAIVDHPYRHAMRRLIKSLLSSGRFDGNGLERFNLDFYHYPQRFFDGIIPALHPMGPMLLRAPSFIDVVQRLYGDSPSDVDGKDFILACYTAAKVYAAISELDNDEIKMKKHNKREKARDPKFLEETLGDSIGDSSPA